MYAKRGMAQAPKVQPPPRPLAMQSLSVLASYQSGMHQYADWLTKQREADEKSIETWNNACVHIESCEPTGDYTVRFDYGRMLANAEATRQIVALAIDSAKDAKDNPGNAGLRGMEFAYAVVLRILAAAYADEDGYDDLPA